VGSSICSAYLAYNCTKRENYVTGLEERTPECVHFRHAFLVSWHSGLALRCIYTFGAAEEFVTVTTFISSLWLLLFVTTIPVVSIFNMNIWTQEMK
jgi:hypothetical protein